MLSNFADAIETKGDICTVSCVIKKTTLCINSFVSKEYHCFNIFKAFFFWLYVEKKKRKTKIFWVECVSESCIKFLNEKNYINDKNDYKVVDNNNVNSF